MSPSEASSRRQRALAETGLLDSLPEAAFDRYTRLASRVLGAPVALVSLVDTDRQFFKSIVGLPEPWASARQTPLSHSFCQHVAAADAPLIVEDAREDERVRGNLAIRDLDVIAYAGMPLRAPDGTAIGSFCAIYPEARRWTEEELEVLQDLADAVTGEIALRVAASRQRAFVSAASHELRTPLAALRLQLDDLALWPSVGGEAAEELRRAMGEVDRLTDAVQVLVDGALEHALPAGDAVEVGAVVRDAAVRWGEAAAADGRALVVSADAPARVHVPPMALRQVLDALVGNALAHGRGRITVEVLPEDGHVTLRVRDEGSGLPPDLAADVFRRNGDGASGLALAAELVRTFGGRLVLLPGGPTTFDLVLPRR
jgi:signal transduction histidine kinase